MQTFIQCDAVASQVDLTFPVGCKRLLVWQNNDGSLGSQAVSDSSSVLDIAEDLISHLSSFPVSDAWLEELKSYVCARLEARAVARQSGGLAVPEVDRAWRVIHPD